MRQRIALYGGAFDPPHNGHLLCISQLLNSGRVDRVIVIPSGDRPDKPAATPAAHRLAMTRLAIASEFDQEARIVVSDVQATGAIGFGTIDVIEYVSQTEPNTEHLVVIGPELIKDLPGWKAADELKRRAVFLVMQRPGVTAVGDSSGWVLEPLRVPYAGGIDISSTALRDMLARGHLCGGLLPFKVVEYCKRNQLYRCHSQ